MIRESISPVEHFQIVEAAFRLAAEIVAVHPPTTMRRCGAFTQQRRTEGVTIP